jgi:hypothetical protein
MPAVGLLGDGGGEGTVAAHELRRKARSLGGGQGIRATVQVGVAAGREGGDAVQVSLSVTISGTKAKTAGGQVLGAWSSSSFGGKASRHPSEQQRQQQ